MNSHISTLFCFGVPNEIRSIVSAAFLNSAIEVQYPSVKITSSEIDARISSVKNYIVAVWSKEALSAVVEIMSKEVPIYRLRQGDVYSNGRAVTFGLVKLCGEGDNLSFGLHVSSISNFVPAEEGGSCRDLIGKHPAGNFDFDFSGKSIVVLNSDGFEGSDLSDQTLVAVLRACRTAGISKPSLFVSEGHLKGDDGKLIRRYNAYFSEIFYAPYRSEVIGNAKVVVTSSLMVALECRSRGVEVIYPVDTYFADANFSSQEAEHALNALNAFFAEKPADLVNLLSKADFSSEETIKYRKGEPTAYIAKGKAGAIDPWVVPSWFLARQDNLPTQPSFAFLPWIAEHGNALIDLIKPHTYAEIFPLHIIQNVGDDKQRQAAMLYALNAPDLFRRLVFSRLSPIRHLIKGMIFTFDWHPFMNVVSAVCRDLDIPRILTPHESVFAKRNMYYVDLKTGIDRPSADIVLAWGDLQKQVYTERRYPADRIKIVGAPKIDRYKKGATSSLTREQYCKAFGLRSDVPIILFSAQPLDSQYEADTAREAQRRIITDLIVVCEKNGWQLILRTPPSRASDVIGEDISRQIENTPGCAIDQSGFYLTTPFDALYHCDALVSINSTMLFEALLLNKPSISAKYLEFTSFWNKTSVEIVSNFNQLRDALEEAIKNGPRPVNLLWAEKALSCGTFDGGAAQRIGQILNEISSGALTFSFYDPAEFAIFNKSVSAGNIAFSSLANMSKHHCHVPAMLNADHVGVPDTPSQLLGYDLYARWGLADVESKRKLDNMALNMGRTPLYIEDGFIRSPGLGLSGDPGLSIILDDITPYYDATRISRLQKVLNSDFALSDDELARAQHLMQRIVRHKVSKYNHAPVMDMSYLRKSDKAVLLVDQRFGDQSIQYGRGSQDTFIHMAAEAAKLVGSHDIFLKMHPDAITGGKSSCLANGPLSFLSHLPNVQVITEDVNPYSMIDIVDEVWVCTSGMGFEALMAGKKVRSFGAPFYAGRGITEDILGMPERTRARSVEEIFFVAYLMLSRYFDPKTNRVCELEDLIDYMLEYSLGVDA